MLEKFEKTFFIIIKNLENMGFSSFCLYTLFIFVFYCFVNTLVCAIEKVLKVSVEPRIYDLFIIVFFIGLWVYGIYICGKYWIRRS